MTTGRSVLEQPGAVISQDHREGNRLFLYRKSAQGEDIVPVKAGMGHLHPRPAFLYDRVGSLADDEGR